MDGGGGVGSGGCEGQRVVVGGEEFAILLAHTSLEAAVRIAERIRQRLLTAAVSVTEATRITVTASFGVAAFTPEDTYEDLLGRTDVVLYRAKRAGRDRVVSIQERDPLASPELGRVCAA